MTKQDQNPVKKRDRKGYRPPADVAADRRFIIDQNHRRIGHMWPEDFEAKLRAAFGRGWIADFSRYAGLSRDTIDLYRNGSLPIPKQTAQLVNLYRWYTMNRPKKLENRVSNLETPWLDQD